MTLEGFRRQETKTAGVRATPAAANSVIVFLQSDAPSPYKGDEEIASSSRELCGTPRNDTMRGSRRSSLTDLENIGDKL